MTVESLISVLDKEVTFNVFQAYDNKVLFDSQSGLGLIDNKDEWEKVKNRIISEFYPTDTRELFIYVIPDWEK